MIEPDPEAIDYFTQLSMRRLDENAAREARTDPDFAPMWQRMRPKAEALIRTHVTKQISQAIAQHEARHATIN
jgi:hypothetical protein